MLTMTKKMTKTMDTKVIKIDTPQEIVDNQTRPVLDHGYVRLVDSMGSDLSVVNAARASFAKESQEFNEQDARLIYFLVREGHWSPFRHAMMTFEVKAPLMVARQHWKYVVGSDHTQDGWNESSYRYISQDFQFYIPGPEEWRSAPDNRKQGSGAPVDRFIGSQAFKTLMEDVERQMAHYNWAIDSGICPEQARLFLPAYGLYCYYRWTGSLQSVTHFISQRLAEDAQVEIQKYARAISALAQPLFPVTFQALGLG